MYTIASCTVSITRLHHQRPLHDFYKNYSLIGFSALSSRPENQEKRKDWWSRCLISLSMTESKYCYCGLCKIGSRCPGKSLDVRNCTRVLPSDSDSQTDP